MCKLPKDRWSNCGIAHQQNHCFIRQGATRAHSHVVFSWITQCQHKILGTNWDFVLCLLLKKMNNKSSISVIYWLCQWTQRNKKLVQRIYSHICEHVFTQNIPHLRHGAYLSTEQPEPWDMAAPRRELHTSIITYRAKSQFSLQIQCTWTILTDSFHSIIQNLYLHYKKIKRLETSSKVTPQPFSCSRQEVRCPHHLGSTIHRNNKDLDKIAFVGIKIKQQYPSSKKHRSLFSFFGCISISLTKTERKLTAYQHRISYILGRKKKQAMCKERRTSHTFVILQAYQEQTPLFRETSHSSYKPSAGLEVCFVETEEQDFCLLNYSSVCSSVEGRSGLLKP